MVAVPDVAGVHWNTLSGEAPELPQVPLCVLDPLVPPVKTPPAAGITVGLPQEPPEGGGGGGGVGGVTVNVKSPLAPLFPSTRIKYV